MMPFIECNHIGRPKRCTAQGKLTRTMMAAAVSSSALRTCSSAFSSS